MVESNPAKRSEIEDACQISMIFGPGLHMMEILRSLMNNCSIFVGMLNRHYLRITKQGIQTDHNRERFH